MTSVRQITTYFLLFVLGILSLKSVFGGAFEMENGDCQEFAHIHWSSWSQHYKQSLNPQIQNNASAKSRTLCHEAKSVLSYSPFPTTLVEIFIEPHFMVYNIDFNQVHYFKSPDPEPLRKPPKKLA